MKKIKYIFLAYITGIGLFNLFRLILVLVYAANPENIVAFDSLLLKSFAIGLQFDTCISCYILSLPLIAELVAVFAKIKSKVYHKSIHVLTCTLFCLAFLISASDIPYFNYFFNHLNASIFSYFNSFDFLLRMIVEESSYLIFLFLFLGVCIGYVFLMNLIYKHTLAEEEKPLPYLKSIPLALLCLLLCFVGMRGRLEMKSPLRIGTAYHCNDPFLNSLGLNPSFVLIKSVEESSKAANRNLELMDSDKANRIFEKQKASLRNPKQELHLTKGTNIVLIIMESMSAEKSGHFNPESRLTPNLDKIADSSLSFEQAYTAGIHTYNGVYSTLFSHPALFDRHSMKASLIPTMDGLPNTLAEKGYQTLYFTTHDSQFDNIAGFLFANGIQKIISQSDYPSEQIKSTLGVSDHVMFEKAVSTISSLDKDKPFFVCMLTSSDHGPYILPTDIPFKPSSKELKDQMVEYADWAIGHFVSMARKQDWFEQTLFVFVADHGYVKPGSRYEMPLSYHHTPMLLYCPKQIKAEKDSSLALQIDLAPTILSMLIPDYENKTMGIDLLTQSRPYAYFCADNKVGVIDNQYFCIFDRQGGEMLYRLNDKEKTNCIEQEKERAIEMKTYAFGMMQKSNDVLKSKVRK